MKSIFIKYIVRVLTAIIIHFIVKMFDQSFHADVLDFGTRGIAFFLFCILFVLFFWYLSDVLLRVSLRYIPSEQVFVKHVTVLISEYLFFGIFVAVAFSVSYALFDSIFFNVTHYQHPGQLVDWDANIGMYLGYCMVLAFNAQFYLLNHWKKTELQNQKLKEENIRSRFEILKNQIEPHFFFNSLSVLSQLVYNDADAAAAYIDRLSKLYRYILIQKDETLVPIAQEIVVLESYIYLIKVRFGGSVEFSITIDEKIKTEGYIPHNTLQMLAENSIKHNKLSIEKPLLVSVFVYNDFLVMKNNIQLRTNVEMSSRIGIENIKHRYALISDKTVEIDQSNSEFRVSIPILNAKDYERTRV